MRRVIFNADDFGLTAGVNRAIAEAYGHGVVTSATLMAGGPAFDQAVESAKAAPRLSVGCHVLLVDGYPLLPAVEVATLISDSAGQPPRFRNSLNDFAGRAIAGRLIAHQIEAEATAQIRKLQTAGIAVSHLDTHKHTHMFPQVVRPILRAANTCGVSAIRNPFEPVRMSLLARYPSLWKRWLEVKVLHSLSRGFHSAVARAGLKTPDGTIGIAATGALDESLLRELVQHLPEGTWEFVCHPGYDDADLQEARTRLRQSRVTELQLLTLSDTRVLLDKHGIQLISYRDLS